MKKYYYGNPSAPVVLIQMIDEHDLEHMDNEVSMIRENSATDFFLIAIRANVWNHDLSPWNAPPVFGKVNFGDGAKDTLPEILNLCPDKSKTYLIGGYSLAGLFAIWASYQTDIFTGVAAASPSMWFPGFLEYMKEHNILTNAVYLSLGDKEAKTKNPVIATVSDKISEARDCLSKQGCSCHFEWNPGNHFKDSDIRTAKAFSWLMNKVNYTL